MTIIGEAYVEVHSKTDGFADETERGVLGAVGGIAKKAAAVMGGAFAVSGAINFGKAIFAEAEEATKGLRQTEAAIKSTGGAANVSAADIDRLTDSVSRKAAVDDDAVRKGANLLLTFTNVRNEAGKGNDIFNQATNVMADMAAAMGTDVSGGAIQLGKALNDPVAGITALTRVGVTFTDQQKDQIAAMVEAGDVAGAQKIILAELNKEFGGSAAAQATAADRARVAWGEFKEELGLRLMPVVERVAGFLAGALPRALDFLSGVADAISGGWQNAHASIGASVGGLEGFFLRLGAVVRIVWDVLSGLFGFLLTGDIKGSLLRALGLEEDSPVIGGLLHFRDILVEVLGWVSDHLVPILAVAGAAFFPLAAAVIYAYTHFEGLRDVVNAVVGFLVTEVIPRVVEFAGFLIEQFGNLVGWVQQHWASIQEAISHVINVVQGIISVFVDVVTVIWRTWGDEIMNIAHIVWDEIRNVIDTVVGIITGIIELGLAIINGDWGAAWDAIKDILSTAWDFIQETLANALRLLREAIEGAISGVVEFLGGVPGEILGALGDMGSLLVEAGKALMRGLLDGIRAGWEAVKNFVGGIAGKIADLKGPLDYDRRLLVPAGNAIMDGLETALRQRQAAVEARVRAITAGIANAGQTGLQGGDTGSGGSGSVPAALLAELRALAEAIRALAGGGNTFNLNGGGDPATLLAMLQRAQDWNAGR